MTTSATGSPASTVYYDALGREVKSAGVGFDGSPIYNEVEYDDPGRKWRGLCRIPVHVACSLNTLVMH